MTTCNTPRRLAAAALAAALGCAACSATHAAPRPAPHAATADQTVAVSGQPPLRRPVIPTDSPAATHTVPAPDQHRATAVVPSSSRAAAAPLDAARAWATAANSSSYLDSNPGQWTERTRPFVTGSEERAEAAQRAGGGGSAWAQVRAGRCAMQVRDLVAFIPSDAPSGAAVLIVYVSARVALACATGVVYLSDFAAQVTVWRLAGRWLVDLVRH